MQALAPRYLLKSQEDHCVRPRTKPIDFGFIFEADIGSYETPFRANRYSAGQFGGAAIVY